MGELIVANIWPFKGGRAATVDGHIFCVSLLPDLARSAAVDIPVGAPINVLEWRESPHIMLGGGQTT